MKIRICRCQQCTAKRRKSKAAHHVITLYRRSARRKARQAIKGNDFDRLDERVSVPRSA